MDDDLLFQSESLDGSKVAVVTVMTHFDQTLEYQVDLYLSDSLGAEETHYCNSLDEAQQLALTLTSRALPH
jgi:hypothetical protein